MVCGVNPAKDGKKYFSLPPPLKGEEIVLVIFYVIPL
jgi:hypothetical protein